MTDPPSLEQRVKWTTGFRSEADKTVLKALVRWFAWRSDGRNVRPEIEQLAKKSGIPKRTVDRALRRLEAGEWIRVTARAHRGPTTYRICLERLATADPDALHLAPDGPARHSGAQPSSCTPEWRAKSGLARHSGAQDESGAQENRPDSDEVARKVARSYSYVLRSSQEEVVEEEEGRTSTTTDLARHSGVQTFLAWWAASYPDHNAGALSPVSSTDATIVDELIADGFPVERLQAMSLALWTLVDGDDQPTSDRTWIARSNRSLRVLRHKAQYLARVVAGRSVDAVAEASQQDLFGPLDATPLTRRELEEATTALGRVHGGWCPHQPKHTDWRVCVRAIAYARRA